MLTFGQGPATLASKDETPDSNPATVTRQDDATERWRRTKIESLWRKLNPGAPAVPAEALGPDSDYAGLFGSGVDRSALILSGTPVLERAPTGLLLAGDGEHFWPLCSVVLTRPATVLTARHCLADATRGLRFKVYFPFEGTRDLAENGIRKLCTSPENACEDDIAILELAAPYRLVPLAQRGQSRPLSPDVQAKALGFGSSNRVLADRGLMHEGAAQLRACRCGGAASARPRMLCFQVGFGPGASSLETFANLGGDSGAPLFSGTGPDYELLGISNGFERNCAGSELEARYADVRAGNGLPALDSAFCEDDCPTPSNVPHDVLLAIGLAYLPGDDSAHYAVTVEHGTEELLLTLNHETNGFHPEPGTDLLLEIDPPLPSDCSRFYGVETCRVEKPSPGRYMIGVSRQRGNPAYQLTAVAILGQNDGERSQ